MLVQIKENSFWETHEGAINLRERIFMKKQFVKICFIFALMIGVQCIFPPPADYFTPRKPAVHVNETTGSRQ